MYAFGLIVVDVMIYVFKITDLTAVLRIRKPGVILEKRVRSLGV